MSSSEVLDRCFLEASTHGSADRFACIMAYRVIEFEVSLCTHAAPRVPLAHALCPHSVRPPLASLTTVCQPAWEAQAILHFAGVPFDVTHSSYPLVPRAGWLPLLVDERRVVRGEAVIPHVCDVDADGTFRVAPPLPRSSASDADGSGQGGASEGGAGGSRSGSGAATSSDTDAASSALLSMVHYELDVLWRRWRWLRL